MGKPPLSVIPHRGLDIVSWIGDGIASDSIADLNHEDVMVSTVFEMMCGTVGLEASAHTWFQDQFAGIGDQSWFTSDDIDEFILLAMTVMQRGDRARSQ